RLLEPERAARVSDAALAADMIAACARRAAERSETGSPSDDVRPAIPNSGMQVRSMHQPTLPGGRRPSRASLPGAPLPGDPPANISLKRAPLISLVGESIPGEPPRATPVTLSVLGLIAIVGIVVAATAARSEATVQAMEAIAAGSAASSAAP